MVGSERRTLGSHEVTSQTQAIEEGVTKRGKRSTECRCRYEYIICVQARPTCNKAPLQRGGELFPFWCSESRGHQDTAALCDVGELNKLGPTLEEGTIFMYNIQKMMRSKVESLRPPTQS